MSISTEKANHNLHQKIGLNGYGKHYKSILCIAAITILSVACKGSSDSADAGTDNGSTNNTPTTAPVENDNLTPDSFDGTPFVYGGSCHESDMVAGALSTQPPPVYCTLSDYSASTDTAIADTNSWLDEFDHGLSMATAKNINYRVFDASSESIFWRHANHWMVDMSMNGEWKGANFLRPDKTFKFENGKLVIEAEYAASHPDYGNTVWGELVVTPAAVPTAVRNDGVYGYDYFRNHHALGCRLQAQDQHTTCSLQNPGDNAFAQRVWEMSFFQHVGTSVFGGFPTEDDGWRVCQPGEGDLKCRDRFRMELTENSLTIYVNGIKYFEQSGIPSLPQEILNGDLYVYFASIVADTESRIETVRFHWDRLAINPASGPTATPNFE